VEAEAEVDLAAATTPAPPTKQGDERVSPHVKASLRGNLCHSEGPHYKMCGIRGGIRSAAKSLKDMKPLIDLCLEEPVPVYQGQMITWEGLNKMEWTSGVSKLN
jgi:hypothetical protein